MKAEILKTLKKYMPGYISGEQISNSLGVSRAAVWKHITELRNEGYVIESSSRRGYRLVSSPDLFSQAEIQAGLANGFLGKELIYFDSVDSTNTYAKKIAANGAAEGTVVIADTQTAGKGRLGRSWFSIPGIGIWMSVILRPAIQPAQAPFITILAAIAVVRAIEQVSGVRPGIKWPNDIVLNGKKVCGILTEMSAEIEQVSYIVIGIGVNVNARENDFAEELSGVAASIRMITGDIIDRKCLITAILSQFEEVYTRVLHGHGKRRDELVHEYKQYSLTLGQDVKVYYKEYTMMGKAVDITHEGELVVETADKSRHTILSGEVSVRGLYGYS